MNEAASLKGRAELADTLALRRERFAVLADVFSAESSPEAVAAMVRQATSACAEEDGALAGAEAGGRPDSSPESALARALAALSDGLTDAFATKTRTEYARLFVGPREVVAPLHESAWRSGTPRTFTAETLAVRSVYERNGFVMKRKNREPEDAIGVELEFLRNLCDRALAALAADGEPGAAGPVVTENLACQRAFLDEHVRRWAIDFGRRVQEADESGFYRVWAAYLEAVLNEDEALLDACEALISAEGREAL